jgi:hypothetical protein
MQTASPWGPFGGSPAAVDFVIWGSLFTRLLERDLGYYLRQIHQVLRPGGLACAMLFRVDHLRASLGGRFTFAHRTAGPTSSR